MSRGEPEDLSRPFQVAAAVGFTLFCLLAAKLVQLIVARFGGEPTLLGTPEADRYVFVLPLLVVPTFVAIYVNWLSLKFFRHN